MELANYLLKSVAILSIFYIVYFAFLRKDTLFNAKRHFFLAGIIAALAFPFVEFTQIIYIEQPETTIANVDFTSFDSTIATSATPTTPIENTFNWWWLACTVYGLGLLVFLGRLGLQLISLLRLLKKYPSNKKGGFRFVEIDQNFSPFSFFRYIVYNPASHTLQELEMILKHEKVHASQWHSLDILSIHFLRAIQWMNPFAWFYKKSIEENLEFLADLHTVSQLPSKKQYQLTLVKASSPITVPALTTQFYQSFIKKRIIMLNTNSTKKHNLWKLTLVLPFLAFFLWSFNVTEEIHYTTPTEINGSGDKLPEFLISSETSNDELNAMEHKLTRQSKDLKVAFVDRERNAEGNLTELSIDTQHKEQSNFYKNVTYGGASNEITPLKLKIVEDQLEFANLDDTMIMRATAKGVIALKFPKEEIENKEGLGKNPLYVINGEEILKDDLPNNVKYTVSEAIVEMSSEEAVSEYGTKANDGAVVFNGKTNIQQDELASVHTLMTEPVSTPVEKIQQLRKSPWQELRFSINKNTTDAELETLKKKARADHGIDLSYTVVRNDNREIVSINLSYSGSGNSGSYNVNDDEPIEEFFFFAKDNGDLGFWSEAHEKRKKEREIEHAARMEEHKERMIEHEERMEERQEQMAERREEMKERMEERREELAVRREEMKERQHEMQDKIHKQKDRLARRHGETAKVRTDHRIETHRNGNYSYSSQGSNPAQIITITKTTTDKELKELKQRMSNENISFSYSKLRRNKNGEITSIKVTTNNGKGSKQTIYSKADDGEPIDAMILEF